MAPIYKMKFLDIPDKMLEDSQLPKSLQYGDTVADLEESYLQCLGIIHKNNARLKELRKYVKE